MLSALGAGLIGLTVFFFVRQQEDVFQVKSAVAKALDALDEEDIEKARELARAIRLNRALSYEDLGGPAFVLGAAMVIDARSHQNQLEKRRRFLVASRYLEEANQRGFPSGREKQGLILLARSTFQARQYDLAIPRIEEAAKRAPEQAVEFMRLLSICHQRKSLPDWNEALKHIDQQLAEKLLTPAERSDSLLSRASILFELARYGDCLEQLDAIPDNSQLGEAIVLRARIDIMKARQKEGEATQDQLAIRKHYSTAGAALRDPRIQLKRVSDSARLAQYLLGECHLKLGETEAALKQFARVRRTHYGFPESLAAALEEAELLRLAERDEEAITAYRAMLEEVREGGLEGNALLSMKSLRKRLAWSSSNYFEQKKFDKAIALAQAMRSVLTEAESTSLEATTYRAWADDLNAHADTLPLSARGEIRRNAEDKMRRAGSAYARLAKLRIASPEYANDLFASADAYLIGSDFRETVSTLELFFEARPQERISEALVVKGQALLALGRLDEAIEPLERCIAQHRQSPESYEARLVLSRVYNEQQETAKSKQTLLDNLESELTPDSLVWRESLFDLGRVLYLEATQLLARARAAGLTSPVAPKKARLQTQPKAVKALEQSYLTYGESIRWLDHAIQRWPSDDRTIHARYMLARSHEQRSKLPRYRLVDEPIETTREKLREETRKELNIAHDQYQSLVQDLDRRQDTIALSEIERKTLRNCYFSQADTLFDLEKFEEAIQAYSSASNRYQHKPEALEAFVRIAACYRRLDNNAKARGTLEQAKVVLSRIGEDADFATTTTRTSFVAWKDFLEWLSQI